MILSKKQLKDFFFRDYMYSKSEEEFLDKLEQFMIDNEIEAELPVKPPLKFEEFVHFIEGV